MLQALRACIAANKLGHAPSIQLNIGLIQPEVLTNPRAFPFI